MDIIFLYHVGFDEVKTPDIRFGRKNADFGQGFYLSSDKNFSERWARTRKDRATYLNAYELTLDGLNVKRFSRDEAWFSYIFKNRAGYADELKEFDVIVGPIANDTLYDTWGITTSGLISREKSMEILTAGPLYEQTVIKTERAAGQLKWLSSRILS